MFSFVRNFFGGNKSENFNIQPLKDLHTGYSIGFGYMPQSDLSGRRFRIGEVNTFRFGDDQFLAYSLQHNAVLAPLQMIVELSEEDPYIALSQVLDGVDQKQLFGREISTSDSLFLQDKIVFDLPPSSHRLSGWAVGTYKKVIDGIRGEFVRGHYQLQPGATNNEPWGFRYYLFASETNEYAVEIEHYDHGQCKISLTVFRPVSDIGQVRKPAAPTVTAPKKVRASIPEALEPEVPVIAHEPVVEKPAKPQAPVMVLSRDAVIEPKKEQAKPAAEVIAPAKSAPANAEEFTLPCPASVAGKLIEESQRNGVPLSQLVRRILGLSVHVDETVIIPFALTKADIKQLSAKFGVNAENPDELRRFLLKEVTLFVGEEEEPREARKKEYV